jgi:hypothetical protein
MKHAVAATVKTIVNAHHCESQSLHTHMCYMTYVHILQVASRAVRCLFEAKQSGEASVCMHKAYVIAMESHYAAMSAYAAQR